jgi:phage-related protein (TIGR01555 family)
MWFVDTFKNLLSGLGTARDKASANVHVFVPRTPDQILAAYRGNWIARKIVDIVPFDELREWRAWQAKPAEVQAIEEAEKTLRIPEILLRARRLARLQGGSVIVIGDGQTDQTVPLDPKRLKQGGIKWLAVFGRYEITPGEPIRDPASPWFGEPRMWELNTDAGPQRIHPSRVVRLVGAPILEANHLATEQGWGDSILQAVFDAVDQATSSAGYVNAMLPEAKQDVIFVPGLSTHLSTAAGTAALTKRFEYAAQTKSVLGMLLLEGDGRSPEGEVYQQKQLSFTGLPDVVRMFLMIASAAADVPATRLLGQSPQGLNATGDSDTRNYYDHVAARQKVELTPAIARLDEYLIIHALGTRPPEIWYEWRPLYQPSLKERADAFQTVANAIGSLATAAVMPDEVLAEGVKGWAQDSGLLPGIDAAYRRVGTLVPRQGSEDDLGPDGRPIAGSGRDPEGEDERGNVVPFRRVVGDATPRTLYVSRKLKNGDDLLAWARSQGFTDLMPAGELHVTIAYSRTPLDWMKAGQTWQGEELKISAGGPRVIERFGEATVLLFASDELRWRWQEIRDAGASWDHPEYQPHVTFTWAAGNVDLSKVQPYNGPLILGPEIFEPVDEDWRAKIEAAE